MKDSKAQRLVGYGVGDFGLNIYWHSLPLILFFWYAEVVGLDPKMAGWIFALGLLWDAVSDPIVASFAAANRSKYGVYRPFILFGSLGLGAAFCLLFWVPPLGGWFLFAALLASAIFFRTCYTIVAVPYSALTTRLTFDSTERAELAGVRMFFAFCGMLCVSTFFFPLSRAIGDGDDYTSQGFLLTALLGAFVATIALVSCFFLTSEQAPLGGEDQQEMPNLNSFLDAIARNDALRLLLVVLFLNAAAGASLTLPMAFYIEANSAILANKEVILSSYALATLLGTPVWTLIARSIGKKKCWYLATVWTIASGLSLYFQGPILIEGVPVQIASFGFAGAAFAIIIWALIPDTVEYGQYQYGVRAEGSVFGATLLAQKASGALTGLAIGYFLASVGYDSEREMQTAETAEGIEIFMALAPATFLAFASITLFIMPLTRDLHGRIVDELSR